MATDEIVLSTRDRKLHDRELRGWLPGQILDAHVHVFEKRAFPDGFSFEPGNCYHRFGGEHTVQQCLAAAAAILPETDFGMLSFGTPHLQVDREEAARYTGAISDRRTRFGLTLISPDDDVATVEDRIRRYGLIGYKPYRNFVTGMAAEAVRIPHMLTEEQMELANDLGLVVMLHIPKHDRLADPDNQRDMVELCNRYPRAQIIFAHIGRAYWYRNVIGNLSGIAQCPNAWLDTAMVNHIDVLTYTFDHFPRERILFGSDAPIAWLRGKSVEINDQYAYLMGEPYSIGTTIYDADRAVEFTFFYYEMLCAIKEAGRRADLSRAEIQGFFHNNAAQLLSGIAQRVHGPVTAP